MNILVFDIETIPDLDAGRRLYDLGGLSDKDVAQVMFHQRRLEAGHEFLRLHLQRVVAISAVWRSADQLHIWSLGTLESSETELLQRFFDGIERQAPTLVSWNGSGFDLPVLHYRALLHGVTAARYWDVGDTDRDAKWNNYLSRYQFRHTDLMDVLAGYQARATAPLHEIATLLGFPGKMGMSGDQVWDSYQRGELPAIRDYCETDVLNTYLIYLRFELMRGHLTRDRYDEECRRLRQTLAADEAKPVWRQFLQAWPEQAR